MIHSPTKQSARVNPLNPTAVLAWVTRVKNEIIGLQQEEHPDHEQIKIAFETFIERKNNLVDACQNLFEDESFDDHSGLQSWLTEKLTSLNSYEERIKVFLTVDHETLQSLVKSNESASGANKKSTRKRSVKSGSSSGSKQSIAASLRIKLAQEQAELEAKVSVEEETKILNQLKMKKLQADLEIEDKQRELEIKEKRVKATSLMKQLDNIEKASNAGSSTNSRSTAESLQGKTKSVLAGFAIKEISTSKNDLHVPSQYLDVIQKQNDISMTLARSNEKASMPKKNLEPFDGTDLTKFNSFMKTFKRVIEDKCDDDADKLLYLEQFTELGPKQLVRSCGQMDATIAYSEAKRLLLRSYGNEYRIANAYIEKLENWPQVPNEDGESLQKLSIFLTSCANHMQDMTVLNQLNSPKQISEIIMKLPYRMREQWQRRAFKITNSNVYLKFSHLADFVREEADVLTQPVFGLIKDPAKTSSKISSSNHKKKTLLTSFANKSSDHDDQNKLCECCLKTNHFITSCFFFKKKSKNEKLALAKNKGLCFKCLRKNHASRDCKQKVSCNVCKGSHLTIMHFQEIKADTSEQQPSEEANPSTSDDNQSKNTSKGDSVDNLQLPKRNLRVDVQSNRRPKLIGPVIPIKMRARSDSNYIYTYAALDPQSSECFLNDKYLKQLNVKTESINLELTTMEKLNGKLMTKVLNNLEITSFDATENYTVSLVYTKSNDAWPFSTEDVPDPNEIKNYPYLKDVPFQFLDGAEIGLLIGLSVRHLFFPLEAVGEEEEGPFAVMYKFGWALQGPIESSEIKQSFCHRIKFEKQQEDLETKIENLYTQDFIDNESEEKGLSVEDYMWYDRVKNSLKLLSDKHYIVDLPFKELNPEFPSNKAQVYNRFRGQERRMQRNKILFKEYSEFMNTMFKNDFAERVPVAELETEPGRVWYLAHHAVYHKIKKKIRIVFDCSLKCTGVSLNDHLLQGPDLTNNLLSLLLRFRQEPIAVMADVEKMYYQVRVSKRHRDYLRFIWFGDEGFQGEPVECRLLVHVFGAKSSPAVANFVLRRTTQDNSQYDLNIKECIHQNFYVDDFLKSLKSEKEAIDVLLKVKSLVANGGFNLIGYSSNSRRFIESLPVEDLAKSFKTIDVLSDDLPFDRALGIIWNTEEDNFQIKLNIDVQPITKRGILSTIFSIYDPLGLVGPAIIPAKRIFQEACRLKISWDEELSQSLSDKWSEWRREIHQLSNCVVPCCIKPIINLINAQLHCFSDGSETAYGATIYGRFQAGDLSTHCSIIIAKARLNPMNNNTVRTIPRIELAAARLSVSICEILKRDLDIEINAVYYWTDSMIVLSYINNETKRFQRYVANRVHYIRSHSAPSQWKYVPSDLNPADLISRGVAPGEFIKSEMWKRGPTYLQKDESYWPVQDRSVNIQEDQLEIKKEAKTLFTNSPEDSPTWCLIVSLSSWMKLVRRVAWFLRLKHGLRSNEWLKGFLSVNELKLAEIAILKFVQLRNFSHVFEILNERNCTTKRRRHDLKKLCPFIDVKSGLLRVGGRLQNSEASFSVKHPIILPSKNHVTELLLRSAHQSVGHLGRASTLALVRENYWIIKGNQAVRKILTNCLTCKKQKSYPETQLMADLPIERITGDNPPFTNVGVDYFGNFYVKHGRKTEKRYGVIFTCMATRAIHIEVSHSMTTDSFIAALRRFQARRGAIKRIKSDNGTNFHGADRELKEAISQWNMQKLDRHLKQNSIEWSFNPPYASHFGGVWERMIRTVRNVLNAIVKEQHSKLTCEEFTTFMCEVEAIINNRPITEVSGDHNDLRALTPNHFLLLNSGITYPPGLFSEDESYSKRRWKQIQFLAELFWKRWRKEYLPLLQERQKWNSEKRSLEVGDLVLVVDVLLPRNQWCLGRVTETIADVHNHVRAAKVKVAKYKNSSLNTHGTTVIERPIAKLILLKNCEEL